MESNMPMDKREYDDLVVEGREYAFKLKKNQHERREYIDGLKTNRYQSEKAKAQIEKFEKIFEILNK
jgi:hypothetical protein